MFAKRFARDCMRDEEREICGLFETIVICDPFTSEGQSVPEEYGGGATAEVVELDDAAAAELDGGATLISTTSNSTNVVTAADQADRLISVFFSDLGWYMPAMRSTVRTSSLIRSRSTSLSSGNDSWAMSMAS